MKEEDQKFTFGVRHIAYNAEMRKRRLERGLTQKQLAQLVGLSHISIGQIEGFRRRPQRSWGEKIATILDTDYETLFPAWMEAFKIQKSSFSTEHIITERLLPSVINRLAIPAQIENTEEKIDKQFLKKAVDDVLKTLTEREKKVIQMRFGMDEYAHEGENNRLAVPGGATLDIVAHEFGVTRERVRQIEAKAIRKLKHPFRRGVLQEFLV